MAKSRLGHPALLRTDRRPTRLLARHCPRVAGELLARPWFLKVSRPATIPQRVIWSPFSSCPSPNSAYGWISSMKFFTWPPRMPFISKALLILARRN